MSFSRWSWAKAWQYFLWVPAVIFVNDHVVSVSPVNGFSMRPTVTFLIVNANYEAQSWWKFRYARLGGSLQVHDQAQSWRCRCVEVFLFMLVLIGDPQGIQRVGLSNGLLQVREILLKRESRIRREMSLSRIITFGWKGMKLSTHEIATHTGR